MNFEDFKEKAFAERPGLKEEYDKIDREKLYVLGRNDPIFGGIVFYAENTSFYNGDVTRPIDATKYAFEDALTKSRKLREFGLHFRIILLNSLLQ